MQNNTAGIEIWKTLYKGQFWFKRFRIKHEPPVQRRSLRGFSFLFLYFFFFRRHQSKSPSVEMVYFFFLQWSVKCAQLNWSCLSCFWFRFVPEQKFLWLKLSSLCIFSIWLTCGISCIVTMLVYWGAYSWRQKPTLLKSALYKAEQFHYDKAITARPPLNTSVNVIGNLIVSTTNNLLYRWFGLLQGKISVRIKSLILLFLCWLASTNMLTTE